MKAITVSDNNSIIQKIENIKVDDINCMFCKNYRTAYGDCKGMESMDIKDCCCYEDVNSVSLVNKVKELINNKRREV